MVERYIVVDQRRIKYSGLFDAKGLFDVIKAWCSDKGYWSVEKSHSEALYKEGKFIEMVFDPIMKKFTDYAKGVIKVKIQMSKVKDVVVERDGRKVKLQEGDVSLILDGILETDYESRWEGKPFMYVLRTFFEKYVLSPFIGKYESTVGSDVDSLQTQIKAFLNLTKFQS